MTKKYRFSEIFGNTFQGEGAYTGRPTAWLRVWGCNFECAGFGQDQPDKPETYDLDYLKIDPSEYKNMEELPVFHRGCDSSYSWAKKFSHLAHQGTASEICDEIEAVLPGGKFRHPKSRQWHHMAFTGGEPMMSQSAVVDVMAEFNNRGNEPKFVTIETNGTQAPRDAFIDTFSHISSTGEYYGDGWAGGKMNFASRGGELFWSVSPKLYLSGEMWDKAIKPEVVSQYAKISNNGQLKFVCNGTDRNWDEVQRATDLYRDAGINWDVWVMPVGADREMQESHQARIAEQAVERGYSVAIRTHTLVFGNIIGK
jgi:organic radical activating enzyme